MARFVDVERASKARKGARKRRVARATRRDERLVDALEVLANAVNLYVQVQVKTFDLHVRSVELREQELQAYKQRQEIEQKMADGVAAAGDAQQKLANR